MYQEYCLWKRRKKTTTTTKEKIDRSTGRYKKDKERLVPGLRCRRPLRVPLLTTRHRTARLQWARAHQDWLLPQWRNVLFSDESRFGLVSDDYRERV
nr:unnamed protein product [Callosobruchus chinensis]